MILILESSPPWIPELAPALADLGAEVQVDQEAPRTDMRAVRAAVAARRPSAVILSGFRSEADHADDAPDRAFAENAEAAINLAAACMEFEATAVLLSTAEVFGQNGGPFSESDTPVPISAWAESRLKGEVFLMRAARERALILRLGALVEEQSRRYAAGVRREAGDERVSPLRVVHLARAIVELLAAGARGTVHVASGGPPATRADVLSAVAGGASISAPPGASLGRRAPYAPAPLLATTHLSEVIGGSLPDWRPATPEASPVAAGPSTGLDIEPIGPAGLIVEHSNLRVWSVTLACKGDDRRVGPCAGAATVAVVEGKLAVETEAEDRVIRPGSIARLPPGVEGRLIALDRTRVVVVEEGPSIG